MADPLLLLGIDNGGTVTKAALYDRRGRQLAVTAVKTEMRFPLPGHAEKDMEELWEANVRVISEVIAKAGVSAAQIAAVGVSGHGNGLYLVDAAGAPVRSGINSADGRAQSYVERWYRDGTFDAVLPRTCQSLWAAQPPALLAWLRDREPAVMDRTRWIFMCKDYIRYRLTGEAWAEITDYSGLNLMNLHDLRYDPEVLDAFGLGSTREKLPPLRASCDICGRINRSAAEATGLPEGTPVAGGLFDIDACAIAAGVTDPHRLCLIAGSWSINEYISPAPVQDRDLFMSSAYCMPGFWLITEASATSASNLEWVVTELMAAESAQARARGESVFDLVNAMVEGIAPGDDEVTFLPFLYGTNEGAGGSACFLGLRGWHTRAHLLRAVFEGVVFSHKRHVQRLMRHRGPARAARIAGGASRSQVWVQMFADALEIPIEVTEGDELGAMGAAMSAGVAVGCFGSLPEAAQQMVRVSRRVEPCAEASRVYEEKFGRYCEAIAALSGAWGAHG